MNKLFSNNKSFAIGLLFFGILTFTIYQFFLPTLIQNFNKSGSLVGNLEICIDSSPSTKCGHWVLLPKKTDVNNLLDTSPNKRVVIRARFESPAFCLSDLSICRIVLKGTSESLLAELNGQIIENRQGKSYSANYAQYSMSVMPLIGLRHNQLNDLVILLKSETPFINTFQSDSLYILTEIEADRIKMSFSSYFTVLPLIGAIASMLVALWFASALKLLSKPPQNVTIFLYFCLAQSAALLTYSSVFDSFGAANSLISLKYVCRYLEALAFLHVCWFIGNESNSVPKMLSFTYFIFVAIFGFYFLLSTLNNSSGAYHTEVITLARLGTPLLFAPNLVEFFRALRLPAGKLKNVLICSSMSQMLFSIYDIAGFITLHNGANLYRLYSLIKLFTVSYYYFSKIIVARTKEISLTAAGYESVRMIHDLKGPLSVLKYLESNLNISSDCDRLLFKNSVSRIAELGNSLKVSSQEIEEEKLVKRLESLKLETLHSLEVFLPPCACK
ncbi:MAG: hypothetical protein EOP04_16860, partial [Proteobacteria bacterium]